jgi:hypothetical protein
MQQGFIASGNIYPCRFVKLTATTTGQVTQCGAGDEIYGVSQTATRRSPYVDSSGLAAEAGEPIGVFDDTEDCALQLGAAVATPGTRLKSDANGCGTPVTSDKDEYGAIAVQTGNTGDQIKVKVQRGQASM